MHDRRNGIVTFDDFVTFMKSQAISQAGSCALNRSKYAAEAAVMVIQFSPYHSLTIPRSAA